MPPRQNGLTLIELMFTLSVLTVGLLGLAAGLAGSARLTQDSRELDVLKTALGNILEILQEADFPELVSEFGPGSGQQSFWCASDGVIQFTPPEDSASVTGMLRFFNRETALPPSFADFDEIDLNGDGAIQHGEIVDYVALPLRVKLSIVSQPSHQRSFDVILAEDGIR